MQAVYGWVKNIIYFMIFLAVVNNLLADSKYEKYIRFFAGMVLILLVVSPLTGKMRLDEQISSMFQSISLHNDASDLKSQLWNMDEKRLDQILGRYQDAVEADVAAMAAADGLTCVRAQVRIDGDRNSSTYGQVKEIRMEVRDDKEQESGKEDYMGRRLAMWAALRSGRWNWGRTMGKKIEKKIGRTPERTLGMWERSRTVILAWSI